MTSRQGKHGAHYLMCFETCAGINISVHLVVDRKHVYKMRSHLSKVNPLLFRQS